MPTPLKKLGNGQATANVLSMPPAIPKGPVSFAAMVRTGSTASVRPPATSQAPGRNLNTNGFLHRPGGLPGLSEQLNSMSISHQNTYEPTVAPRPPMNQSRPRNYGRSYAPSAMTAGTRRTTRGAPTMDRRNGKEWINTPECIKAPYGSHDFNRGDVISVPFHVSNMNPDAKFTDTSLRETDHGPVYTKRRMFVILFKYQDGMYCLPLYSFGSRGITVKSKPIDLMDHYVCLRDSKHRDFISQGPNAPIDFVHGSPYDQLTRETTIHLTGGLRFHWEEYIGLVGRLTKQGYARLLSQWKGMQKRAEDEADSGIWPVLS